MMGTVTALLGRENMDMCTHMEFWQLSFAASVANEPFACCFPSVLSRLGATYPALMPATYVRVRRYDVGVGQQEGTSPRGNWRSAAKKK